MTSATQRQSRSDNAGRPRSGLYIKPVSAYRPQIEAAQLEASVAATSRAALLPLVLANVMLALFWSSPQRGLMLPLLALVAATAGAAIFAARRLAQRALSHSAVRRSRRVGGALGLLVGAALAAMLLAALDRATLAQSLGVLAALLTAMSGAWLCGPVATIGTLYLLPLAAGGALAFAARGGECAVLSPLILLAAAGLAAALRQRTESSAASLADRLRIAEQAETMDALLLDQESGDSGWIWETDAGGRLHQVGTALAASIGAPTEAIEGALMKTVLAMRAPRTPMSEGARAVRRALADRKPFRDLLVEIAAPDGAIWWRLSGKPLSDAAGRFAGFRGIGADITVARDTEARIAYLANFDSLTGLANRARFLAHAADECRTAARDGRWRAMLYVDLDGFKSINDGLGHAAGDLVLREVGRRLVAAAPAEGLCARLGGDEFAIWYPATPARAEALAHRLIEVLRVPFDIDGIPATIAASIGIAYAPKHAVEPDALLGKADLALYRAKADGKGVARTFVESDELAVVEKRRLEADLKVALGRGELELHYQPLVDLDDGSVVGFEALIRWNSPTRGLVSPAAFVPAAEASGLITAIGRWVLVQACRDAASWPGEVRVAVNVSPKQFGEADFPRTVAVALQTSGLKPTRLEIEVTEGVFLDHSVMARAHLATLRERGIRVALDDFGTGYSSLSYLTSFPVDKIKIDRSFVQHLDRLEDQAVVEAILTIARRLSIHVTAEGVETAGQALELKMRRCDDVQGYLLSKPRPAAEVPAMLLEAPAALAAAIPVGTESPLVLALALRRKSA